jgi:hypothetical protein
MNPALRKLVRTPWELLGIALTAAITVAIVWMVLSWAAHTAWPYLFPRAHAQTSWCASNCQIGTPTPEMQRLNKEQADRRARFEKKWGQMTSSYNDQTLERIERNPTDPDCWQYTPTHCY